MRPTVLYDGYCKLCSGFLSFVLSQGGGERFEFRPLEQGEAGSVVLMEDGRRWEQSDAALRILARLDAPWRWLAALRAVPKPARDAAYRWVARNRYRFFGRRETCRLP
jgi:predicted DCC family thiol-disulfide oxidoreductase YuxK